MLVRGGDGCAVSPVAVSPVAVSPVAVSPVAVSPVAVSPAVSPVAKVPIPASAKMGTCSSASSSIGTCPAVVPSVVAPVCVVGRRVEDIGGVSCCAVAAYAAAVDGVAGGVQGGDGVATSASCACAPACVVGECGVGVGVGNAEGGVLMHTNARSTYFFRMNSFRSASSEDAVGLACGVHALVPASLGDCGARVPRRRVPSQYAFARTLPTPANPVFRTASVTYWNPVFRTATSGSNNISNMLRYVYGKINL